MLLLQHIVHHTVIAPTVQNAPKRITVHSLMWFVCQMFVRLKCIFVLCLIWISVTSTMS